MKVCIIGAGTGGLCLAQGLKQDRVDVEIYERDRSPSDRLQGYRLSINAAGHRALKACLPDALFQKLITNCAKPSQSVTFLDHRLRRLLVIDLLRRNREDAGSELPVSRIALRRILVEGLDGIIQYDKKFVAFEDAPGGAVTVRFEDGSSTTADVLVGADGAGSHLRAQLLPQAQRVKTDIVAVSGKLELSGDVRRATPQQILRGPTLILGPRGCFMFASTVDYEDVEDDADQYYDREKYVMWGFSAHDKTLNLPADSNALDGPDVIGAVLKLMSEWHPALRWLVQTADESTVAAFSVRTSVPIRPWTTRNVTLLGDALHNMTPYRGIGANTALRDAAALRHALAAVASGQADLVDALADYESNMIAYGFAAVQRSRRDMERFHAEGILARFVTKSFFRAVDHLPPLKTIFLGR